MTHETIIVDRGRGPEIRGTRITVLDVMDYYLHRWNSAQIAAVFQLPPGEIDAAIEYIEQHRDEVDRKYEQLLERQRRYQLPREIAEKLEGNRRQFANLAKQVGKHRISEAPDAHDHARQ